MPGPAARSHRRQRVASSDTAEPAPRAENESRASNAHVPWLTVRGAAHNNLQNIDVRFPLGRFTCVTGVSGSGKSSLINDILYRALARTLNRATSLEPGRHKRIDGLGHLDKVIAIDQSPIGRTPRSNPATYIKVFDEIRALFAKLPDAKLRGYKPGRFSFNVPAARGGGRCEACEGHGANKIEMDFLADVWVTCPVCDGRRFNQPTLQMRYKGHSIADVLRMEVGDALTLFENVPRVRGMLQTLHDVGLDYIQLGQSSTTLSGGEAQRIKLARELVKKETGRTLYVLDEPTTGLHFDDIRKLLAVLHGFVDAGNTVVVIEHNLDVVKTADWVIDLGPEGGEGGGRIVAEGTPEEVAACAASHTGQALGEMLGRPECQRQKEKCRMKSGQPVPTGASPALQSPVSGGHSAFCLSHSAFADEVRVVGARQHNLKDLTVSFPRERMTVCTGVSGSGKTSFAIDTVFAEGYRRYVESLSAYARQFLGQLAKPRVDHVEGLSPAICIEQRSAGKSPRSTVGTVTEIYDYMRVLWARLGTRYCPRCQVPIGTQTADEIVARLLALPPGSPIILLAPIGLQDGENYAALFNRLRRSGYLRVRVDGEVRPAAEATTLDPRQKHRVEVVIDRTVVRPIARARLAEGVEHALALGNGVMTLLIEEVETVEGEDHREGEALAEPTVATGEGEALAEPTVVVGERAGRRDDSELPPSPNPSLEGRGVRGPLAEGRGVRGPLAAGAAPAGDVAAGAPPAVDPGRARERAERRVTKTPARELLFSAKLVCTRCGTSFEELGPNHFSFNSQLGWCDTCEGLGVQRGAPAAAIISRPNRTLFDGALDGWHRIEKRSPLGRLLAALCEHLGVRPDAPLSEWTPAQRQALLYGTAGTAGSDSSQIGRAGAVRGAGTRHERRSAGRDGWIDGSAAFDGVRFQWRGLFPAIDQATRNSWTFRYKLRNIITDIPCVTCRGGRLRPDAAAVRLSHGAGKTIVEVCDMPLLPAAAFFANLSLDERERRIAGELLKEIQDRLQFLIDVGLHYLTLHRAAPTLSGGEAQRIRLASQIGSGLSGVLYVLDEPTIGMHPRDTQRLVAALLKLRDLGNTLLVVEHDREVIRHADRLLDFGPRAGNAGGRIVAEGTPTELVGGNVRTWGRGDVGTWGGGNVGTRERGNGAGGSLAEIVAAGASPASGPAAAPVAAGLSPWVAPASRRCVAAGPPARRGRPGRAAAVRERSTGETPVPPNAASDGSSADTPLFHESLTRAYLSGAAAIPIPGNRRPVPCDKGWLVVRGARQHNLKNIDVPVPLGRFVCITGVSGSGKSSLVNDILWPTLANRLHRANLTVGEHDTIEFDGRIDKVVNVDQSPIGSTPASNPATYTGVFDSIRELFARLPESKMRGYNANRFSFNRPGGRCEACEGQGQRRIEMHFMPDVWVECETCHGRRYNPETLEVRFKGQTIADVLDLRVGDALRLFENVPRIRRMLQTLVDVGLDYVQLGQPAPTLSGGEAQRVKLAAELGQPDTGQTFYILDEPTTGLHFDDIRKLLAVIHRLVDLGNTVLVVEHNLDVIKCADWVIDLGPEAGDEGGQIVAAGTPEEIVNEKGKRKNEKKGSRRPRRPSPQSDLFSFCIFPFAFASHTASALKPVLDTGPYEERPRFDRRAHAAQQLDAARRGFGDVGKEVRMPWQIDGRKWHLEQRRSREDEPRRWEPAALEYVLELVQRTGEALRPRGAACAFEPTNWSNRASVEITAPGADTWFLHALTGGEWLLELYFQVPRDTFKWHELDAQLGLKTLDERDDLETYGDWARVDVRPRRGGLDAVVVYVHDKQEIDTPGFRRFVKEAVKAYLAGRQAER